MAKKKVGFFGGTFDPIHFGHINLALQIKEKKALDEVIFCPAFVSPHKLDTPPFVSKEKRLKMLTLALKELPFFSISDFELKQEKPSFTVDTVVNFLNDKNELYLILSEETLLHLPSWKNVEKLLKLAPPLVGCSENYKLTNQDLRSLVSKDSLVPINWMQINSTYIRQRLNKKLFCGHLVPKEVLDYIHQNNLYY
jgi:nicotinate-nucleotide adenylyltransferase